MDEKDDFFHEEIDDENIIKVDALLNILEDVEEAKKELEKSKELLEKTFLSIRDSLFILDKSKDPRILDCNSAAVKIFGYAKKELLGKRISCLHASRKEQADFEKKLLSNIESQGYLDSFEYKMKKKNGKIFPSEHYVYPLKDENDEIQGWTSIIKDITEKIKAKEAVRDANKLKEEIIERAPFGVYIINKHGNVDYVNPEMLKIAGNEREVFEKLNILDLESYKNLGIAEKIIEGLDGKGFFIPELDYIGQISGKRTVRNMTGIPIKEGKEKKLLMVVEDLTELKRKEDELKVEREFKESVIQHGGVPILAFSKKGDVMIKNDNFREMCSDESCVESFEKWIETYCPNEEVKKIVKSAVEKALKGEDTKNLVLPITCKDGSSMIVVSNIAGVKDQNDDISGVVIFMRDLSEIFNLEEQIRSWASLNLSQAIDEGEFDADKSKIEITEFVEDKAKINKVKINGTKRKK